MQTNTNKLSTKYRLKLLLEVVVFSNQAKRDITDVASILGPPGVLRVGRVFVNWTQFPDGPSIVIPSPDLDTKILAVRFPHCRTCGC